MSEWTSHSTLMTDVRGMSVDLASPSAMKSASSSTFTRTTSQMETSHQRCHQWRRLASARSRILAITVSITW